MRHGYSNLLGEYVLASEASYNDCRNYLIVCPFCREALFKAHRPDSDTHYFSHYRDDQESPSECEARCRALSAQELREISVTARGQRLALFMRVIPDELERCAMLPRGADPDAHRELYRRFVRKSKAFDEIADEARSLMLRQDFARVIQEIANRDYSPTELSLMKQTEIGRQWIDAHGGEAAVLNTRLHARTALDVLRHLLTMQAKPAFRVVAKHAALHALASITHGFAQGSGVNEEAVATAITKFTSATTHRAKALADDLRRQPAGPPKNGHQMSQYGSIVVCIIQAITESVCHLNYADILRRNRA